MQSHHPNKTASKSSLSQNIQRPPCGNRSAMCYRPKSRRIFRRLDGCELSVVGRFASHPPRNFSERLGIAASFPAGRFYSACSPNPIRRVCQHQIDGGSSGSTSRQSPCHSSQFLIVTFSPRPVSRFACQPACRQALLFIVVPLALRCSACLSNSNREQGVPSGCGRSRPALPGIPAVLPA